MKMSMALDHRYHIIDSSIYIDYEVTEEENFGMKNRWNDYFVVLVHY
jgi:hypothetical protein